MVAESTPLLGVGILERWKMFRLGFPFEKSAHAQHTMGKTTGLDKPILDIAGGIDGSRTPANIRFKGFDSIEEFLVRGGC